MLIDSKITTFVDGGYTGLKGHHFVSDSFNKRVSAPVSFAVANADEASGDSEQTVKFRLNQTGNIFYSSTTELLTEETKKLFDSVTVLFAAMTKALGDKGYNLFNYDKVSEMIQKSGYFVEVQKYQKNLEIKSTSVTIDTQVISQLLPGLTSGSSLEIAKGVLNALNGEFSSGTTDETTKHSHLLFICEELFGAPSVTVRLFFGTKTSHKLLTSSPCHKSSSSSFEVLQEATTYLFVSPDTIAEFAEKFKSQPQEYTDLIERLKGLI
ncbi:hypothetical protein RB653_003700 [Dictyostelium firmibasis]|uniref:Zygote formation protein zyg1 n=1 Tax=Dictyostelium firmibasis TaxID=79012 RepID=A0AAN7U573_9MYCE